jgi:hypothetical protein
VVGGGLVQRFNDIQELLHQVDVDFVTLAGAYEVARADADVKTVLRPLVKSCFEHLRSCLEYCAQEIADRYGASPRFYFPYGCDETRFLKSVQKNFPGLQAKAPRVYAAIAAIQPFKCSDAWLQSLCEHTNFNKHDRLTNQDRVNSAKSRTFLGGNSFVINSGSRGTFVNCAADDVRFGVTQPLVVSDSTPLEDIRANSPGLHVRREFEWVEFRFSGTARDAAKLIDQARLEIRAFATQLRAILASS